MIGKWVPKPDRAWIRMMARRQEKLGLLKTEGQQVPQDVVVSPPGNIKVSLSNEQLLKIQQLQWRK